MRNNPELMRNAWRVAEHSRSLAGSGTGQESAAPYAIDDRVVDPSRATGLAGQHSPASLPARDLDPHLEAYMRINPELMRNVWRVAEHSRSLAGSGTGQVADSSSSREMAASSRVSGHGTRTPPSPSSVSAPGHWHNPAAGPRPGDPGRRGR
jgi:hypothetical protein